MSKLRALIAEDESLVALEISDTLKDAGFETSGPYANVSDALEAAANDPPSVAIVDMMLRDDSALALADFLSARQIPYVILSGLQQPLDGHYRDAVWLAKPFDSRVLLDAVDRALGRAAPPVPPAHGRSDPAALG